MNFRVKTLLLILFTISLPACKTIHPENKLRTGDLIFVETNEQSLSGAISRVTKGKETQISYDHLGIVEINDRKVFVLHASSRKGTVEEDLRTFMQEHGNTRLVVYRLKKKYRDAIPHAIDNAKQMLGKPYNSLYILNDSSYYCSDYVQRAFRKDSIFKLNPMTFVNPMTGEIDAYWKNFYAQYDQVVPEGKLGCNPNGLALSDKIDKLFILNP